MPIDALVDSLFGRLKRSSRRKAEAERRTLPQHSHSHKCNQAGSNGNSDNVIEGPGFLNHAHDFIIHQPTMIENRFQIVNMLSSGKTALPVLEHLAPHATPDAVMDSGTRCPPPRCHPGTRLRIGGMLEEWVHDKKRQSSLIWLHGAAGTGKTAVAQTFAEYCSGLNRLGAAFFFSRPNKLNNSNTVVPTLVYQMAISLPDYKALITNQLVNDPQLLQRAPRTQFKKLIVEPLTILRIQEHGSVREPVVIILDGLDECEGEDAQCEIVNMIAEAIGLKKDPPLLWFITSRPEPHLRYVFSRSDFPVRCTREELAIDATSRADVEVYLRDGLAAIKAKFWDVTALSWPSEQQIKTISRAACGLFIFAAVVLKYVGDSTHTNPMGRLDNILSFLNNTKGDTRNPLKALDLLYTQMLNDIADDVLPMTKRILSHYIYIPKLSWVDTQPSSAQSLCNFLNIDQSIFYRSLRKLHSAISIPIPEEASEYQLRFFHASFEDYLIDSHRSGKYFIDREEAIVNIAKSCLYWYKLDLKLFHRDDGPKFNYLHQHGNLPGLKWVSPENEETISREIASFSEAHCWRTCSLLGEEDAELLAQIYDFDFKYIRLLIGDWPSFVSWLWKQDPSNSIIRTEPLDEIDLKLMAYMNTMTSYQPVQPATFPLDSAPITGNAQIQEYFLIGNGLKSSIFWLSRCHEGSRIEILNCEGPCEEKVSEYQKWFVEVGWYDSDEDEVEDSDEDEVEDDDKE